MFGVEKWKVKALTLTLLWLSMKSEKKRWDNIMKIIFLWTREKEENFDKKIMILR